MAVLSYKLLCSDRRSWPEFPTTQQKRAPRKCRNGLDRNTPATPPTTPSNHDVCMQQNNTRTCEIHCHVPGTRKTPRTPTPPDPGESTPPDLRGGRRVHWIVHSPSIGHQYCRRVFRGFVGRGMIQQSDPWLVIGPLLDEANPLGDGQTATNETVLDHQHCFFWLRGCSIATRAQLRQDTLAGRLPTCFFSP